ncbi:unnamed protein product [Brassica oleracea]
MTSNKSITLLKDVEPFKSCWCVQVSRSIVHARVPPPFRMQWSRGARPTVVIKFSRLLLYQVARQIISPPHFFYLSKTRTLFRSLRSPQQPPVSLVDSSSHCVHQVVASPDQCL